MEVEDGYYFSTINEYLNLPKTNYAIQLNGPWGIGKRIM